MSVLSYLDRIYLSRVFGICTKKEESFLGLLTPSPKTRNLQIEISYLVVLLSTEASAKLNKRYVLVSANTRPRY